MNEAILIWLYLSFDGVIEVFSFTWLFSIFVLPFIFIIWSVSSDFEFDGKEKVIPFVKPYLIFTIIVIVASSFYPSKEDLKWIIGGALVWNGVEAVSDLEGVSELPQNTLDAMNHFLESVQTEEETSE